jgi:hypothetical protein
MESKTPAMMTLGTKHIHHHIGIIQSEKGPKETTGKPVCHPSSNQALMTSGGYSSNEQAARFETPGSLICEAIFSETLFDHPFDMTLQV